MSTAAVNDLLTAWDRSTNPILHAAAGQMRQAIRTRNRGQTCHLCGREGVSRFVTIATGEAECWNTDACDRRVKAL